MPELLNAFTVDVEDYYQVSAFEAHIDRTEWDHHESRVVGNTHRVLDLLARHGVRGTFFVLGWVAERYPKLVQEIQQSGHEIGSHGYWHRLIYRQSPEEFRADIRQSRDVLQSLTGRRVIAYRAPSFSITKRSLWALEILAEEGFRVDCSVFPIRHDRYGIPDSPLGIHEIETPAGRISEFPSSVARFFGARLPVSGGGYFRLFPLAMTLRCLAAINRKAGEPFMFYIHPWEIDPDQPRLAIGSRLTRFRHYVNLAQTEAKLDTLLHRFRFGRVCDVVETARTALRPNRCPQPSAGRKAASSIGFPYLRGLEVWKSLLWGLKRFPS